MDIFKKVFGWLVNAALFIWWALPKAMDWVGRSTLPDDWDDLMSDKLPDWAGWLFSTPSWVPAILATILTAWLIWASWPRNQPSNAQPAVQIPASRPAPPPEQPSRQRQVYEGEHEQLMRFVGGYLLQAVSGIFKLQTLAIRHVCPNGLISNFAERGAKPSSFTEYYERLNGLGDSPAQFIPLNEMINCVKMMELNYRNLPEQIRLILEHNGVAVDDFVDAHTDACKDWQTKHNAMVEAYEAIKTNSQLGDLFRPVRQSRWGRNSIAKE